MTRRTEQDFAAVTPITSYEQLDDASWLGDDDGPPPRLRLAARRKIGPCLSVI